MSYYYNYRIGYMKDGKLYPLGPCDASGKFKYALSVSRSFASDMHEHFYTVVDKQFSDELKALHTYKNWEDKEVVEKVKYLPLSDLPDGPYIRTGYFLISEVEQYRENRDPEVFTERLPPETFAARLLNEATLGSPQTVKSENGTEYTPHSAGDYMYYAYPDYNSKEYEADVLRLAAGMLEDWTGDAVAENLVILEDEG